MESGRPQKAGESLMRILAVTLVLTVMSATMFNIVLPEIRLDFHLTYAQVSWVSSAYMLTYAIGSVTYGKLADIYKLKHLLTFGLIFFAVGSMIGLASQAYWMVLLGRVLQAVGASVIPAAAMIIPSRYFPPETRGRALGLSAAGLALGSAVGPVVSALVVSLVHWRWLFCMPLLVLPMLPLFRKYLGDEERKKGKYDGLGGSLLAGAVALLLLAVTYEKGGLAAAGLIGFLLFIARIRYTAEPFVRPHLFKNRSYSLGLVMAFLAGGIGYSFPFLSPQLFSNVYHLVPGAIGLAMFPAAISSALLGRSGGKLADAKGNPFLFYSAAALLLTGFALLSSFAGSPPAFIALFLIIGNIGQTFMQIALSNTISRTLPKEQVGVGMGFLAMTNFMAGSVAAVMYSKVMDHGPIVALNPINAYSNAFVFSNIYFFLAVGYTGIIVLYYLQFDREARKRRSLAGDMAEG